MVLYLLKAWKQGKNARLINGHRLKHYYDHFVPYNIEELELKDTVLGSD